MQSLSSMNLPSPGTASVDPGQRYFGIDPEVENCQENYWQYDGGQQGVEHLYKYQVAFINSLHCSTFLYP